MDVWTDHDLLLVVQRKTQRYSSFGSSTPFHFLETDFSRLDTGQPLGPVHAQARAEAKDSKFQELSLAAYRATVFQP